MRIRIIDEDGCIEHATWADFVADNSDAYSDEDFDAMREAIVRRETVVVGGGAAPLFEIIAVPGPLAAGLSATVLP